MRRGSVDRFAGFDGAADVARLAGAGFDAFLVGEVYLPAADVTPYLEHLDQVDPAERSRQRRKALRRLHGRQPPVRILPRLLTPGDADGAPHVVEDGVHGAKVMYEVMPASEPSV